MMKEKVKNPIFIMSTFAVIGILLRLYYFPYEIPFSYDMLDYFAYALSESRIGGFPENVVLINNGWPTFVSIFVSLSQTNNLMELTYLQRILSISFSVLTIIPIYLLVRKFFTKKISVIIPALFIFEPNILMNSVMGGTIPIFIFLGTTIILLFLNDRIKIIIIAFALIGVLSFVRYEGLLLIIPLSIMFFIRFRNKKNEFKKYFFMILVFLLVISPIAVLRMDAYGQDGFVSSFISGSNYVTTVLPGHVDSVDEEWVIEDQNNIPNFLKFGVSNLFKFLGISMLPIFIFFLPISIFYLFKKRNQLEINTKILSIIFYSLVFLIPAFYLYGRHIEELRYMFILYPLFSLLSAYSIKIIFEKIKNYNMISTLLIFGVIVLSVGFIEYDKPDYLFEKESFYISKMVVDGEYGYNTFSPASKFIKSAEIYNQWPTTIKFDNNGHVQRQTPRISDMNFSSLNEFLIESENKGLTHLIVDDRDVPIFLKNIFLYEKKYPYLEKIYDSSYDGLEYQVKIFKINYKIFNYYLDD